MAIAFLEYKEADHGKARSTPYVANLINWLEWEVSEGRAGIVELVAKDKFPEARTTAGMVTAYEKLLEIMHREDVKAPDQEPKWIDETLPIWEQNK